MSTSQDQTQAAAENELRLAACARLAELLEPAAAPPTDSVRGPANWNTLGQLRFTPPDPGVMAAPLTAEFAPETLWATNCFEEDDQGGLQLISGLRTPQSPVVVTRSSPTGPPVAIAADGRPSTRARLAGDFFMDFETRRRIEACRGLFLVTLTVAETTPWLRFGLPAMPIGDLANASPATRLQFWKAWRAMKRANPAVGSKPKSAAPPRERIAPWNIARRIVERPPEPSLEALLVAPGWHADSCELRTDGGGAAVDILRELDEAAPFATGGVGLWTPAASRLAEWQRVFPTSTIEDAQILMKQSLAVDLELLAPPSACSPPESSQADDLVAARRRLFELGSSHLLGHDDLRRAEEAYLAKVEEQFIAPLQREAAGGGNPGQNALLAAEAMLLRRLAAVDVDLSVQRLVAPRDAGAASRGVGELTKLTSALVQTHAARQGGRRGRRPK